MQFITIVETNHKENETFIHYCQWDGNEVELEKLFKMINFACYDDMAGDYSDFYGRIDIKLPESMVDEHVKLKYGCFDYMFQKHVGVFKCPDFGENDDDPYEVARSLDDIFYACKLGNYFKPQN